MKPSMEQAIAAAIAYDAGDPRRIHHLLKVHAFARQIGLEEGLDPDTQFTLETAAVVHDIGIHRAEALYGRCTGQDQEALGPDVADRLLTDLGWPRPVIDRVRYLVGHHHTYTHVEGLDYRILLEADFLVNLYEDGAEPEAQRHAYQQIFQTESGRRLCRALYPAVCP